MIYHLAGLTLAEKIQKQSNIDIGQKQKILLVEERKFPKGQSKTITKKSEIIAYD